VTLREETLTPKQSTPPRLGTPLSSAPPANQDFWTSINYTLTAPVKHHLISYGFGENVPCGFINSPQRQYLFIVATGIGICVSSGDYDET
jgi:hypothetical protein